MSRSVALRRNRRQRGQSLLQTLVGSMVLFGLYFGGTPVLGVVGEDNTAPAAEAADYDLLLRAVADEIQSSSRTERDDAGLPRLRAAERGPIDHAALSADFPVGLSHNSELTLQGLEGYGVVGQGDVGILWGEPVTYRVEDGALVRVQGASKRVVANAVVAFHAELSATGAMDVVLVTGDSSACEVRRISAAPLN